MPELVVILPPIAFSGELVPQDLNGEPASAVLKWIREERAANEARRKGWRGRGASQGRRGQPKKTHIRTRIDEWVSS